MKRKVITIVGLLFIFAGVVLLILPQLSTHMIKLKSNEAITALEALPVETIRGNQEREVDYDFDAVSAINVQDTLTTTLLGSQDLINAYQQDIVGQLVIKDLGINLVLFNGINDDKLLVGVTTMKANQVMGQGNYAIAGHYVDGNGILFNQLPNITTGMTVRISDKENIYEYVIYKTELVPATSIHLIDDYMAQEHGTPIISLMSCYYYDNPDKRWFAFGELVSVNPYDIDAIQR